MLFFFSYGWPRTIYLHALTLSFPTRSSSDLFFACHIVATGIVWAVFTTHTPGPRQRGAGVSAFCWGLAVRRPSPRRAVREDDARRGGGGQTSPTGHETWRTSAECYVV